MDDIPKMTDEELMLLCVQDNLEAFSILFHRYQRKILNFAWRYLDDRNSAEDILQETFLRMFLFRKSFNKKKASFATWLYTIAKNLCFQESQKVYRKMQDMLSSEVKGQVEELEIPDCQQLNPLEKLEQDELREKVNKAISLLPQRQREAVILKKYQGMSLSEIAKVLNCSEGAVKQLIQRALLSLRTKLTPYIKDSDWR
jgi:RNA polymerase sigma-70 factor (ECF subfamily)